VLPTVLKVGCGNADEKSENDALRMSSASSSEFTELKLALRALRAPTPVLNLLIDMVIKFDFVAAAVDMLVSIEQSCEMAY